MRGLVVDLFAGGGGASVGLEAALGRSVDIAIDHDATAMDVHKANHPDTRHLEANIWEVRPLEATLGLPVDVLWASPDCTHFSVAKGGQPRQKNIRSLPWAVVKWAATVKPRLIFLENVAEFRTWGPLDETGRPIQAKKGIEFRAWLGTLQRLGYDVDYRVLDASLYGAPTKRKRLFLVARRDGLPIVWPEPTHGPGRKPLHTAAECIDWSIPCPSIFERKRPLAEKTQARIAEGLDRFVLKNPTPYIVQLDDGRAVAPILVQTGYGERAGQKPRALDIGAPLGTCVDGQKHGLVAVFLAKHFSTRAGGFAGGQRIDQPFGTVTTKDHHALVYAFLVSYYGQDVGQPIDSPMRTLTTKDRLGLVTVSGVDHEIADIGMRMLGWPELLRAQFGRFAKAYDMTAAKTQGAKIRLIGNSVCPEVAEAIVRANVPQRLRAAA